MGLNFLPWTYKKPYSLMLISRLVAFAFVIVVALLVALATFLKDPADSATRLPANLDLRSIDLPAEPFDNLALLYTDFDLETAKNVTHEVVSDQLTGLIRNELNINLDTKTIESLVQKAVSERIDDQMIEGFYAVLTPDAAADQAADDQSIVDFGNRVGEAAADLMLAMQGEDGALTKALEGQGLAALNTAIRPRFIRLQRVAYLQIPEESYVPEVAVTGSTRANRRATIRARTGSPVAQILANRGDYVEAGQTLLILEDDGRQAQRLQVLANIAQAEANLISAQANINSAQALLAQGQTGLSDAQENQADILALGDFASDTQRRNATSGVTQATQNLNVAQSGLAQAEAGLAQAEASLESAQASLVQIDLDIARLTITAPFSGRIEERHVEIGSSINPGDMIFTLADLSVMTVSAQVSDSLRQKIALGSLASVRIGDGADALTLEGPITFIDATSDGATRTFEVEMRLENRFENGQPLIVDNQFATVTFSNEPKQVFRIPQSALTSASITSNSDGTTGILTLDQNDRVEFTEITFADYSDGGELLIDASRLGQGAIRLITGRGGFVKIGDRVNAREQHRSID